MHANNLALHFLSASWTYNQKNLPAVEEGAKKAVSLRAAIL